MKCAKCGYLGFEHVDRCRNCGYEFSLAEGVAEPDRSLLHDRRENIPPLDLSFPKETASATPSTDLPLFGPPNVDDVPLITKASPPRKPLAVRRATPDVPRLRAERRSQTLDLALDPESVGSSSPSAARLTLPYDSSPAEGSIDAGVQRDAGWGSRLVAVAIDLFILAIVDTLVVYFTLQICGITVFELGVVPKGPLLAFLLVQNGGYLVAFTAGGQTLGKMAVGIRVVSADAAESLDLGRATLRTLLWFVLAIPGGLGFLTALVTRDHRGLHDRFAGTRVVRA